MLSNHFFLNMAFSDLYLWPGFWYKVHHCTCIKVEISSDHACTVITNNLLMHCIFKQICRGRKGGHKLTRPFHGVTHLWCQLCGNFQGTILRGGSTTAMTSCCKRLALWLAWLHQLQLSGKSLGYSRKLFGNCWWVISLAAYSLQKDDKFETSGTQQQHVLVGKT